MSKIGERSILDVFLLAVLHDGVVATPYDFARRLGVSPGASIPSLRRLLEQGLVERERKGSRRRRAFTLTKDGIQVLRQELSETIPRWVDATPLDAESLSRVVALAYNPTGNLNSVASILKKALKNCREKVVEAKERLTALDAAPHSGTTEQVYSWVLTTFEVARWRAQLTALKRIHSQLCARGDRLQKGSRSQ